MLHVSKLLLVEIFSFDLAITQTADIEMGKYIII